MVGGYKQSNINMFSEEELVEKGKQNSLKKSFHLFSIKEIF